MRQILLELGDQRNYPVMNIREGVCLPAQIAKDGTAPERPSSRESEQPDGFGRQAQVVRLLDRARSILHDTDKHDVQSYALGNLDHELQDFLTVTMSEYKGPGSHCGANATALRYIYSLLPYNAPHVFNFHLGPST